MKLLLTISGRLLEPNTDPEGFDNRRLVTVPVATVIEDPEFRDLITRHVGRAPVLEPVELTGLAEPGE